jgi:hypothetical protein
VGSDEAAIMMQEHGLPLTNAKGDHRGKVHPTS